jgi:hypothetical protein
MNRVTGPEVWGQFDRDPRSRENAAMRASDVDRDIVLRALGEAYAEGRIDSEEFDERSDTVHRAKTLGELPGVLDDLVPASAILPYAGTLDSKSVEAQAIAKWEKSRRDAFMGFLIPTVVCWVIWLLTMPGEFLWPLFPTIGSLFPLVSMTVQRKDMIESNKRKIVRRHEKELRRQEQRRQLPPSEQA